MASAVKVIKKDITTVPHWEVVNCQVTNSGDTYVSRFGEIFGLLVTDITTAGGAKATWAGSTVTITCTNADYVNLLIFGK